MPRLLCVDDEPMNLELLEAILIPNGYEVIKAATGNEALGVLRREEIDLVLLDVMMPGLNGYEACRLIKAAPETADLPVIMITSLSSKEDRVASIEAGAEDFITKPFEKTEVLTRVKKLLETHDNNSRIALLYGVLSGLAERGNKSAEMLSSSRFNFFSEVDGMIRGMTSIRGRGPRGMLLGMEETGWINYQMMLPDSFGHGKKFQGKELSSLLEGGARVFYSNENETASAEASLIIKALSKEGVNAGNFICRAGDGLCLASYGIKKTVNERDMIIIKAVAMQVLFLRSVAVQIIETEDAYDYLVVTLARAAEANDEDTGRHVLRVGEYAALLAEKMGLDPEYVEMIRMQAQMHDVGKIHIRSEILKKPSELTAEEFEVMKLHTVYGAKIIGRQVRLSMGNRIAAYHHEKWDGSGYPEGLRGEEIPLEARITAIADQYDALRNERAYKPAFSHEKAYDIIAKGDGRTSPGDFDPAALAAFIKYAGDFEKIYDRLKG